MSGDRRKLIRQAVVSAITETLATNSVDIWNVTASRKIDHRGKDHLVIVRFSQGELAASSGNDSILATADMVLHIRSKTLSDDQLDTIADECNNAVRQNKALLDSVSGIVPAGFTYPIEDEDLYNEIQLSYSLTYLYQEANHA